MLEERLCLIEGAEDCRTTATGMAAVNAALLSHLKAGDRVVAARALFGSCHWIVSTLLPKFGIETEFVDGGDLDQWRAALATPANLVLLETPSNPMLEIVDLPAVADLAHKAGAIVVVDNVFATPLLQQPLQMGADVVVYSWYRSISTARVGCWGVRCWQQPKWINDTLQPFIRNTGPAMSPFNAWVLLKGMETLAAAGRCRLPRRRSIADFLAEQPGVSRVWYPSRSRPSAARPGHAANEGRRHRRHLRSHRRQGRCVPCDECIRADRGVEQPGRFRNRSRRIRRPPRICASGQKNAQSLASPMA